MSPTAILPAISFNEIMIFLILLIVGIIVIIVLKAAIHFLLPTVAAFVIWLLTHSLIYVGIAFVAIAILQLVLRKR